MSALQDLKTFIADAFIALMNVSTRCGIRLCLWLITVVGALFPSIHAADVEINLNPYLIAKSVNQAGLFRDFFYIVVVVALISMCEIINTFSQKDRPHSLVVLCYVMAIVWMIYVLIYGSGEFSYLVGKGTEKYVIPDARFHYDFAVIVSTCVVSLLVEFLLAFRGE